MKLAVIIFMLLLAILSGFNMVRVGKQAKVKGQIAPIEGYIFTGLIIWACVWGAIN